MCCCRVGVTAALLRAAVLLYSTGLWVGASVHSYGVLLGYYIMLLGIERDDLQMDL